MTFAGINYWAVLLAALAAFAIGMGWYMAFGKIWMKELGKTKEDCNPSTNAMLCQLARTFVCEGIMAFVLAGAIGHLGAGQVTPKNGCISGGIIWAGFVLTTMVINYSYQQRSRALFFIDAGHWLVVFLVMGAIIGAMGVQ